ncbi:hypothetical protein ACFQV2_26320 [Actinokineospora soli]|uniref:Uncharacterized protein n=1 Tax=Actinokineospora soli TaxID=1048753 RepID=A0ABW2TVI5_9PSEU
MLLEKPPAITLAEFRRLLAAARASGRACQVGFQSLGSAAVAAVRDLVADGAVGAVRGIGVAGRGSATPRTSPGRPGRATGRAATAR